MLDHPKNRVLFLRLPAALYVAGASAVACLIHFDIGGRPMAVVFDALVCAGAVLVGLWAGLGQHSKIVGFVGVGASMVLLAALVFGSHWHGVSAPLGPGNDVWVTLWLVLVQLALAVLSMAVTIAAMLWLRQRGVVLVAQPVGSLPNKRDRHLATSEGGDLSSSSEPAVVFQQNREANELDPIHFSLRQLFLLMAAVGIMLKLGPVTRAFLDDYRSYLSSVVAVASGSVVLGAVGLAAFWAVFGGATSAGRIGFAILLAAALGFLPPYYFPQLLTDDVAASVVATTLEALFVMAILAPARAGGYCVVRRHHIMFQPPFNSHVARG
jgi:hypothetical protein